MTPVWAEKTLLALDAIQPGLTAVIIRLDQQKLYLFQNKQLINAYFVSSSRYGIGCAQDSQRTPSGIHQVAKKIGQNCQPGEIFRARIATGEIADIVRNKIPGKDDFITSRILWLRGLEPGINQGEGVDSYHRYIYIHGTNEEGLIGQPASVGCIRMKNDDVIDLFDRVNVGTLVSILPE